VLLIQSSDSTTASSASLQLQNSIPTDYAEGLNTKGFSVSATETGDFQVASETRDGEARALLTIDGATWETSLSGALRVERDGVNITGGLIIETAGLNVRQGGANITGGLRITDMGLQVIDGGLDVQQGGATVQGGIVVEDSEVCKATDPAAAQEVHDSCAAASLAGTNLDASDACAAASLPSCVAMHVEHCRHIVGQSSCDTDTDCEYQGSECLAKDRVACDARAFDSGSSECEGPGECTHVDRSCSYTPTVAHSAFRSRRVSGRYERREGWGHRFGRWYDHRARLC